jgi:FkbM family methyltransferase
LTVPADSTARRIVKRILHPVLNDATYSYFQCLAKAWDIRVGEWTEPELDVVRHAVRPGDTVLDIGANFGLYTYHLGRAVGPAGTVWAFEPVPFTFKTLSRVAAVLRIQNAKLINRGCSDEAGPVSFQVPLSPQGPISAGLAHLAGRGHDHAGKETQVRWKAEKEVRCEVIRLDDYLPPIQDIPFIKCDIEGAEPRAFRGAERLIDRHLPTIVCEINPWYLQGFHESVAALWSMFSRRGYQLYRLNDHTRRLAPAELDQVVEDNYVFVHPSRKQRLTQLM